MNPNGDYSIKTDLVLEDGIPDVLRQLTHRVCVCVIFMVVNCTGSLQNRLQLDPDFFKSTGITLCGCLLVMYHQNALI